jgi:hypothetical protein
VKTKIRTCKRIVLMAMILCSGSSVMAAGESRTAQRLRSAVVECRAAASAEPEHVIQLLETKTAICYLGPFTFGVEEMVFSKLRDNKKTFVVRSKGGSVIAAARVGLHILDKQIDVAVFDICFSACANYLFLAGRAKYVADETLLAWHGASRTDQLDAAEKILDSDGLLTMTRHYSGLFFRKVGIDRNLAAEPNTANPDYPDWQTRVNSTRTNYGWTWTQDALKPFGVRGIVKYWYGDSAAMQRIAARHRIDLLVDR